VSTALYALHAGHSPADQELARATTENLNVDEPADLEQGVPEFNETVRADTQHAGITTSNLAPPYVEGHKYAPEWSGQAQVGPSFSRINDRQATAGTAAAREEAGQFGHGTMPVTIGIEPIIRDGGAYGDDYFGVEKPGIQPGMSAMMEMAPGYDTDVTGVVTNNAKLASHDAASSGNLPWLGAMMPGVRHG
jgi:hypothetical protein